MHSSITAKNDCSGPTWAVDDFSPCFRRQYLQNRLPLFACALSLAILLYQIFRSFQSSRSRASQHVPVPTNDDHLYVFPPYRDNPEADDISAPDTEDAESEPFLLQRTRSQIESVVEVDEPRGKKTIVAIEAFTVLVEVVIHLVALAKLSTDSQMLAANVAGLITWIYILAIVSLRLLLSAIKRPSFSKLWNHTTILYGCLWILNTLLFRSALIRPTSKLQQVLSILDFVSVTILATIALTARKGNKAVVLEYEGDLEPSREPLASVFSIATFAWVDAIVWTGYKKTFELADIWNLRHADKSSTVLSDYRQFEKTSRLAWHLVRYFKGILLLQGFYAALGSVAMFAPTLIIKAILEYVEDPATTPRNAAWFYVILLFFTGVAQSLSGNMALWLGRRLSVHLRSIIVGEIYAKALRRKAASGSDTVLGTKQNAAGGRVRNLFKRIFRRKSKRANDNDDASDANDSDSQANTGTIINLMAVDSFKVAEVSAYLHFLWACVPVQIIISVTLLYRVLGYSSIAGMGMMVLLTPVNIIFARRFSIIQEKIMAATDGRIHSTNEVLQNIRIIKFFAWEERFVGIVNEKRTTELKELRSRYITWTLSATIWYGAPVLITFFSFLIFTVVEKRALIPSIAFTAISLFGLLRLPLDQLADMLAHVQESKVSVNRVEQFLNEDETEKYIQLSRDGDDEDSRELIGFDNASFSWGSKTANLDGDAAPFRLLGLNFLFKPGKLNIIAGSTGSGKTSLLMALLGEMTLLEGSVYLPGGRSREEMRKDPESGLIDGVAYCAQQAWLVNDTIKENILFASPWNPNRYKEVLKACSLERDLEILDAGDQTLVGEKGITLSGGQKQRVSLARALYCNSKHVLLDDCLSAVDSHTAKWIFENCVLGPLMINRTCILVTHNVVLCVPRSQYVVVLDNGKIAKEGTPDHVIASGILGEEIQKSRPSSKDGSKAHSRVHSLDDLLGSGATNGHADGAEDVPNIEQIKKSEIELKTDLRAERKAEGGVKWNIIHMYLKCMGSWYYWVVAALVFSGQQLGNVGTNIWIREWANSYHRKEMVAGQTLVNATAFHLTRPHSSTYYGSCHSSGTCSWNVPNSKLTMTGVVTSTSDDSGVNVMFYLSIYALIGVVYLVISLFREGLLFYGSLAASFTIHNRLMNAIVRAKFSFFDSTPLGQLMNRFSKDLEAIDQEVAPVAIGTLHCFASVVTIVILISAITPAFLIPGFFITILYFLIGKFYIRSSRDLKRIESVQRSPLYQQFGETLSGVTTIRAYCDERRFVRDNLHRINTHNRPFLYLWATNRWLAFRVDVVGCFVSFFAGAFVIMGVGTIDPGAAGLALSYAVTFTENVLWMVRLYAVNEQNMNSVERIKEYVDVDQEAVAINEDCRPAKDWPSRGSVKFSEYTTRYRPDLDPVLRNVTFSIEPREKVGIVGRTGAGKSSLALALFRGLEAESGRILIDDVDIARVGLKDLRQAVTIVPQDPTLFTGTIRSNLDPFSLFPDEEIFAALRRVQLIDSVSTTPTLIASTQDSDTASSVNEPYATPAQTAPQSTSPTQPPQPPHSTQAAAPSNKNIFSNLNSPVTESGLNLSQGQRQLLCLARAMLKIPKVLLMDEATASIDYATDAKIQGVIRELDGTIITIAHRLQTIIDYDKVLVLDKGRVVEFDHPWKLVRRDGGVFRAMCEMSGDLDGLEQNARKAWEGRRLVDDE
ncbi:MAG: hypothetical protein M1814_003529 [Vezdaea aestivalis]|nr:MAG: hypothetical protein M1814_003529 [Vezdaea aestivalis]